jgi:hypothetical protein
VYFEGREAGSTPWSPECMVEPICMQISEFEVSGAEIYGTKPPNIDLSVKFLVGSAEDQKHTF